MKRKRNTVAVELGRVFESGCEMEMVFLADSPKLKRGVTLELAKQPGVEWEVYSVHRCNKRADGTLDHSRCFD